MDKSFWKKVLEFVVKVLQIAIAVFLAVILTYKLTSYGNYQFCSHR